MTYQTSPYMPWIFPDEAVILNQKGIGKLKPSPLENQSYMLGIHSEPHSQWRDYAHKEALARVRNTKLNHQGMEGLRNVTARSQRADRPASRSSVKNGQFHGSPMEYSVTAGGLRGGVIYTKAGQEWVDKRIKQRIEEYDAISSKNFSKGPPAPISLNPTTEVLDATLSQVFDQVETGNISQTTVDTMRKLESEILRVGSVIDANHLGDFARSIQQLVEALRPAGQNYGTLQLNRISRELNRILTSIDFVIKEIARTIYEDKPSRELVMSGLRARMRPGIIEPSFATPGVAARIRQAPEVQLGRQNPPSLPELTPVERLNIPYV